MTANFQVAVTSYFSVFKSAFHPQCHNWFASFTFQSVNCSHSRKTPSVTFDLDLDSFKLNQQARYLRQSSRGSKVTVWTRRHTHWTENVTWTSKMVECVCIYVLFTNCISEGGNAITSVRLFVTTLSL